MQLLVPTLLLLSYLTTSVVHAEDPVGRKKLYVSTPGTLRVIKD